MSAASVTAPDHTSALPANAVGVMPTTFAERPAATTAAERPSAVRRARARFSELLGATLAAAAAAGVTVLSTPSAAEAQQADPEKVYAGLIKSTAWVISGSVTGTGSLIDGEKRLIVTNHHVVGDNAVVDVLFPMFDKNGRVIAERASYLKSAKRHRGRVVARDPRRDLAVIQLAEVPAGVAVLPMAAESPAPGARVHSIGNPSVSGALWVYTSGAVRQVYKRSFRLRDGREVEARVVETQSPINSGDSGGPVVNDKGELVAIVQSYEGNDARLVSTFIDVSELKGLLSGGISETPEPATAANSAVAARIDGVRQEHNVTQDNRKGMLLHVAFQITGAKGQSGELVAVFFDRNGRPMKANNKAYGNAAGELCAFQRIAPGYDTTAYKDLTLFLPYDELTTYPGKNELKFVVNVWCDRRWVAEKAVWDGFLITHSE
jgi:S1-C subfamily serine protease